MTLTAPSDLEVVTGFVDSDGERIYFEVTGSGTPLVLCHGLGGNHAIWWRQLDRFATDHTVITWDQRGFGNSTGTGGDFGPGPARRDLAAVLDAVCPGEPVHLVGQSLGGWVALGFALTHPDRVRSLVLSTTLAGAAGEETDRFVAPGVPARTRRRHPVLSETFCATQPDLAVLYNQISSFGAKPPAPAVVAALRADTFPADGLAGLAVPTLLLAATDDAYCPPDVMRRVAAAIPGAEFTEVPGGHSAYYETPGCWNDAVLTFIAQRERTGAR
ncbi:MAG TPA: alpha/beta fold hydrolase [Acidimicrobiia bacterium]